MANTNNKRRKKRTRRPFLAVDIWMKEFSPMAERAVYDVYAAEFKMELHNVRQKKSFSDCVNALRKLEDPTYEYPKNQQSY